MQEAASQDEALRYSTLTAGEKLGRLYLLIMPAERFFYMQDIIAIADCMGLANTFPQSDAGRTSIQNVFHSSGLNGCQYAYAR